MGIGGDSQEIMKEMQRFGCGRWVNVGQNVRQTLHFHPFSNDFPAFRPKFLQKHPKSNTQNVATPYFAAFLQSWSRKTRL